jgi:hypothetical protein
MAKKDDESLQDLIISAKKEGIDFDISHLTEITQDMPLERVMWYFNNMPSKRYEVERMFFDHFKTYQDWYGVYKVSKPKDMSFDIALVKIRKMIKNIDDLLEIYDVDFSDEVMRKLAFEKIIEVTPDSFDAWLYIYDESIFDLKLNKLALKRCLRFATDKEHWQKIYDRSDIGSAVQLKAIQQLYGRIEIKEKELNGEAKLSQEGNYKSQKEYNALYDEERFGSNKQENILINKYLAADAAATKDGGK